MNFNIYVLMIITIKFSGRFFFCFSISGLGIHNCVSTFPYLIKGKEDKIVTSLIYCLLFTFSFISSLPRPRPPGLPRPCGDNFRIYDLLLPIYHSLIHRYVECDHL